MRSSPSVPVLLLLLSWLAPAKALDGACESLRPPLRRSRTLARRCCRTRRGCRCSLRVLPCLEQIGCGVLDLTRKAHFCVLRFCKLICEALSDGSGRSFGVGCRSQACALCLQGNELCGKGCDARSLRRAERWRWGVEYKRSSGNRTYISKRREQKIECAKCF